jgi:selenide,water dikinase
LSLTELGELLKSIPQPQHPNLLVGTNTADDAGVFKLTDEIALIQTVDFFTPVVDDPYIYGQIAAANSLSDVYAMGGRPITALNIVGFHQKVLSLGVLEEILTGGFDKTTEAGAVIVGGHTIMDEELKYGLSVSGVVHPERVVTNAGAQAGDKIVLTKPLGTGIISTALKSGKDLGELNHRINRMMTTLNKTASEVMQEIGVHACTDVTGFGLLGHSYEVAAASNVGINIWASQVPYFEEAVPLVTAGFVPGGTENNRAYLKDKIEIPNTLNQEQATILFDAQTSGGLLIFVSEDKLDNLTSELKERGVDTVATIGEAVSEHPSRLVVMG